MSTLQELTQDFIIAAKAKGHILITNIEDCPDCWNEDEDGAHDVAIFAYSIGYHNGPVCKACGAHWCQHCTPVENIQECSQQETK